jgi:hypothetical protein
MKNIFYHEVHEEHEVEEREVIVRAVSNPPLTSYSS